MKYIYKAISAIFLVLLLTILAGGLCGAAFGIYRKFVPEHTQPPTGWGIACDGQGHYAKIWPNGFISQIVVEESRQECVDSAWAMVEYLKEPHETVKYNFKPCEK